MATLCLGEIDCSAPLLREWLDGEWALPAARSRSRARCRLDREVYTRRRAAFMEREAR
jgi:hypothetical protein